MIAFEDVEMSDWLLRLEESPPGQFLYALAKAVLKATEEDYSIIRPALMELKRKYSEIKRRSDSTASIGPRKNRGS